MYCISHIVKVCFQIQHFLLGKNRDKWKSHHHTSAHKRHVLQHSWTRLYQYMPNETISIVTEYKISAAYIYTPQNETNDGKIFANMWHSQARQEGDVHCTVHAWLERTSAWLDVRGVVDLAAEAAAAAWSRCAGGGGSNAAVEPRRLAAIDWRRCCSRWRDCTNCSHDTQQIDS